MVVALSDIGLLWKVKMSSAVVEEIAEGGADRGGQWCAENVD